MGKFKKGDRIIVDKDDFYGGYKAGDEFEVIHCDGEAVTFIDRDGDKRYLRHDHIQPVPVAKADDPANSTAGFTVPVFDEDDFDICGHRDSDGDIVQLSVGELTAALADSLKVARKVGKTIKRGDLVILARPALVTGVHRYHASVQTDGGNYNLPLAALTAA